MRRPASPAAGAAVLVASTVAFALVTVTVSVLVAAPRDVREAWQPLPHPSMAPRENVLTGAPPPSVDAPADAPNVLLITVDTWRADRLGLFGSPRPTSPWLEEFAEDAVVFERATAPSSWTWPTMVSIASGLHPRSHGAYRPFRGLCEDAKTLAETLYDGGWRTGFAGSNSYFEPRATGYRQGFEYYWAAGGQPARKVMEYSGYFLDAVAGKEPWFLHAHLFEPHCPYDPEDAALEAVRAVPFGPVGVASGEAAPWQVNVPDSQACHNVPPPPEGLEADNLQGLPSSTDAQEYLDHYDAELHETDALLRTLQRLVDAMGGWENAYRVVLAGDHGEEFGEHGYVGHGTTIHSETTWVPLLIRPPGGTGRGAVRVSTPVSLVDISPTLATGLGLPVHPSWQGRDLGPALRGEPLAELPIIAETLYEKSSWGARAETGSMRLVLSGNPAQAHVYAGDDFGERSELLGGGAMSSSERARVFGLAAAAGAELRSRSRAAVCAGVDIEADADHWEQLRSQGYLGAGPGEGGSSGEGGGGSKSTGRAASTRLSPIDR